MINEPHNPGWKAALDLANAAPRVGLGAICSIGGEVVLLVLLPVSLKPHSPARSSFAPPRPAGANAD